MGDETRLGRGCKFKQDIVVRIYMGCFVGAPSVLELTRLRQKGRKVQGRAEEARRHEGR